MAVVTAADVVDEGAAGDASDVKPTGAAALQLTTASRIQAAASSKPQDYQVCTSSFLQLLLQKHILCSRWIAISSCTQGAFKGVGLGASDPKNCEIKMFQQHGKSKVAVESLSLIHI